MGVSVVSSGIGIVLAWREGFDNPALAVIVLLGAVLAQAGINLINDLEDLKFFSASEACDSDKSRQLIIQNALAGLLCFSLSALIAAYLVYLRGWPLLLLIFASAVLALNYNMGPLNFKHRGLAVVQVFILMGIVLVQGAYMSMSGTLSLQAVELSIPVSLLVSLLLLSNELRDWELDRRNRVRTLTVRIGYDNAVLLYWILISLAYVIALLLLWQGALEQLWWLLLPLPLLIPISRYLNARQRKQLTPLTGRFFFLFGIAYLLSL